MIRFTALGGQISEAIVKLRGGINVSRGKVHDLNKLPGLIAEDDIRIDGIVLYHIANCECEIVTLDSFRENMGIGTKLIELVKEKAIGAGCKRLWLVTTNDNIRAIRFYQKRGFDMLQIHYNAVHEARKLKPSIPLCSSESIPIKHEIEFEMIL